jgi:hypothetical protein
MKLLLAFAFLSAWAAQEKDSLFTDDEKGYSILIPQGWSVTRLKETKCLKMTANDKTGANFVLNLDDADADYVAGKLTGDSFIGQLKEAYPKQFEGFELVSADSSKAGDDLTVTLDAKLTSSGIPMRMLQKFVFTKTHVCILAWCVAATGWEAHKETFQKGAKSFKLFPKK